MSIKKLPFTYTENLATRAFTRLPDNLHICENTSSELLIIIRLLSGTVSLKHKSSGVSLNQNKNFFASDLKSFNSKWETKFPKLISDEYSVLDLSEYLQRSKWLNQKFYKNLLLEISNFVLQTKKGSHTSAFIFIYRIIEIIAYAFPLIYVAKTPDFKNSYNYLKNLMDKSRSGGEKDFLKKFVEELYKDDPISESTIDFEIPERYDIELEKTFDTLKNLCTENMLGEATQSPRILSIKFTEVGSFLITLRNRFFHFSNNGQKNIDTENLYDSDYVFGLLNEKFMHWITTIFLGILMHNIGDYENLKNSLIKN
jgi:hypothetical protein